MKIEKRALAFVKFIRFIVTIGITVSAVFIFACIGGFENGYMTIPQFITYMIYITVIGCLMTILHALLNKLQTYIEKSIKAYYKHKKRKAMRNTLHCV